MVGQYKGTLVGFRTYDKDGQKKYVYDVFCSGVKKDSETGLYLDECKVVSIIEEKQVLATLKYGEKVDFYGEMVSGKNGAFLRYIDIRSSN